MKKTRTTRSRFFLITLLLLFFWTMPANATVVRVITPLGLIDIALYDDQAPQTVANFLGYIDRGAYDDSFIHRAVPGFVIQGGGYTVDTDSGDILALSTDPPVANEYDPTRSNLRGTIAMAKVSGDPDSATSQWFFNLADNSANLDSQNGGFTVFGEVMGRGMEVVDAITALTIVNAGSPFDNLPLLSPPVDGGITLSQLVRISHAAVLPTDSAADVDRLFNYLEQWFPDFIAPAGSGTESLAGYSYREYPGTGSYVGVKNDRLYYLGPFSGNRALDIGAANEWILQAIAAGY